MYIYIYMCMYVCIYIYIYIYIHKWYAHTRTALHAPAWPHVTLYALTPSHTMMYTSHDITYLVLYFHSCAHTRTRTHTHVYRCTLMYILTFTHTHAALHTPIRTHLSREGHPLCRRCAAREGPPPFSVSVHEPDRKDNLFEHMFFLVIVIDVAWSSTLIFIDVITWCILIPRHMFPLLTLMWCHAVRCDVMRCGMTRHLKTYDVVKYSSIISQRNNTRMFTHTCMHTCTRTCMCGLWSDM